MLATLSGSLPWHYARGRCLFLFIALRWMQEPCGVMVGLADNIQACLRIFRRPQHLWLARDILHQPQGVFAVFVLWPAFTELIRSIRLIRGKIGIQRTGASLTRRRISLWLQGSLFVLPTAAILFSGGLEGPARQDWELRHRAAVKTRLEQRPTTEFPRRNAS